MRSVPRRVMTSVSTASSSPDLRSAPERGEEPLGVLPEDDVVDDLSVRDPERARHARIELDRAHARVEIQQHAQRDLGHQLGAVRVADVGKPRRAEEDGVDGAAEVDRLAGQVLARAPVEGGADLRPLEREAQVTTLRGLEHAHRLADDLGADPVAPELARCGRSPWAQPARWALSMRTATSSASTMLSGLAMPFHARSKAVP